MLVAGELVDEKQVGPLGANLELVILGTGKLKSSSLKSQDLNGDLNACFAA